MEQGYSVTLARKSIAQQCLHLTASLGLIHDLRMWWADALRAPQPSILPTTTEADVVRMEEADVDRRFFRPRI